MRPRPVKVGSGGGTLDECLEATEVADFEPGILQVGGWTVEFQAHSQVSSEGIRTDNRGPGGLTAYQLMAGITAGLGGLEPFQLPDSMSSRASLQQGLGTLWSVEAILALQEVWLAVFLFVGRSTQNRSELLFHVRAERI